MLYNIYLDIYKYIYIYKYPEHVKNFYKSTTVIKDQEPNRNGKRM